ncbi:hypothetical protein GGF43_000606 [Coemansia sp. RSA 2618]|nr:hypothetical protein GGF43_000606 [Coemansia sp. RSA 2618]
MSDSDDTASSVRQRSESPLSPDSGKRRKLSIPGPHNTDWTLEVCPGTDETLQLGRVSGARKQGSENALDSYRLETVAAAEREASTLDDDDDERWCSVVVSAQRVAVTLGRQIHVLSADCARQEAVISHDRRIHATALSSDASFVAFGDAAGTLYIVHVETRRAVFSQRIAGSDLESSADADTKVVAMQFAETNAGREELVVADARGHAMRFAEIQLRLLGTAIARGDMALAARIKGEISVETVRLGAQVTDVAAFHAHDYSLLFASGGGSGASLSSWRRNGGATRLADAVSGECVGAAYTRVRVSGDGRFVVALGTQGVLDVYERATLTRVFRYAEVTIDDFGLLGGGGMTVVALSTPTYADGDGDACRRLVVVALPSMAVRYAMDAAPHSWLAQDTRGDVTTVVFVEGAADAGVQRLFLRRLHEAVPMERLDHFLRAGRFAEAHAFAEAHDIPVAAVHRRRLEALVTPGSIAQGLDHSEPASEGAITEALELAEHVDAACAVNACMQLVAASLSGTQRLLAYARRRAGADADHLLILRVEDAERRLGTWSALGGAEQDSACAWAEFRAADLAARVRAYAAQGDVVRVAVLWRRHAGLRDDVAGAVQGFPLDTDAAALATWLRAEVLPALPPAQWDAVAAWVEQRARALEARLRRPADALQLVALLDSPAPAARAMLTPQQLIDASRSVVQPMRAAPACVFLRQQLADVAHLRAAHGLVLTLDEHAQLSYSDIATALLDRVAAPELLVTAYAEHFAPYARRHALDCAELVRVYCVAAMDAAVGGAWEPRVLALLTCLHTDLGGAQPTSSRTGQARALGAVALEAMRRSAIPWSDGVDAASRAALGVLDRYSSDEDVARLAAEAREQLRLMRLKRMLRAHGLADAHISDTRMAGSLLQWLARRPGADVMRDVLQLVDAYHHLSRTAAYVLRLQGLCETGDADAAAALIGFIDAEEHGAQPVARLVPLEVARRTLCWTRDVLDSMAFGADASRALFRRHVSAAVAVLRALEALATRRAQDPASALAPAELARLRKFIADNDSALGAAWQLLEDGGLMVSPGELEQPAARGQILADILRQQWLGTYSTDAKSATLGLPLVPPRIRTLATMLRFTEPQLGLAVSATCLRLRLFTMALDMSQQLVDTDGDLTCALRALAACERSVSAYLADDSPADGALHGVLVRRLAAVSQAAALKCAAQPQLVRFLDAHACWALARAVFDQTTDGDFAALTRQPSAIPMRFSAANGSSSLPNGEALSDGSEWLSTLYTDLYSERGLVLDTAPAMRLVYRLVAALQRLPVATVDASSEPELDPASDYASAANSKAASNGKSASKGKASSNGNTDSADGAYLDALEAEDVRAETVRRCGDLVACLVRSRHWLLAVQAFELAASQLARSSFVVPGDALADGAGDALALLRRRLEAGGVETEELAELLGEANGSSEPKISESGSKSQTASKAGQSAPDVADLVSRSLARALQQPGMDAAFIFACMLSASPVAAYQRLSTAMGHAGLQPARVVSLANVGAACSRVWQQQALLDRCRAVAAAARWSAQLQLLRLKFDVARLSDPTPELLEPLVRPMLARTGMDIATLLEFAEAFRLDTTFVILEYIALCCSAPHVDSYQARILGVADEVANSKLLERTYADALEASISAYDYERLQFVVQRLQELRPQDKAIARHAAVLDILCSYDRKVPPSLDELRAEWSRTRATRDAIRQIYDDDDGDALLEDASAAKSYAELVAEYPSATRRLPFHGLIGSAPWSVLLAELSAETVDLLLPLAQPLELSEDDFYMNLIDAVLRQWRPSSDDDSAAALLTAYELAVSKTPTRFNAVQHLIRCFKDPEAAISTIKHAADEFPCGPDRVAALKMGIKLLRKWGQYIKQSSEPEPVRAQMMAKAETIYMHFEKSYADAMTEIALRRNRMEQYLPLFADTRDAESAIDVLAAVFEGECTRSMGEATQHDDRQDTPEPLHEVLRRLAAIYDIGLESLLQSLLTRYLESPIELTPGSAELQLPSTRYQASLREPQSAECVLRRRIVYILGQISDSVSRLLSFAYSGKGGISCLCRARALDILFSLAAHDDIAQQQRVSDVQRYFQALLYLGDFEYVGIPQSIAEFLDCDKAALARSIWVDHYQDPKAVQLICNMCLDFGVDDKELVLRMVPRLLAAKLFRYVVGVLDIISAMPCYAGIDDLPAFWNQAVAGYLLQLARSDGLEWMCAALAVLGVCVRSPHLLSIDSGSIVDSLAQIDAASNASLQLACVVFDVFPRSQAGEAAIRASFGVMDADALGGLVQQLLELDGADTAAVATQLAVDWRVSRSMTIAFDLIDEQGTHEQALLRPPLGKMVHAFVRNRIANDKLLTAVSTCIERGKRQLALQLVSQYYSVRPVDELAEDAQRAQIALDDDIGADSGRMGDVDNTVDSGTPHGTLDISLAARKRVSKIPDGLKLDIFIRSHK